MLPKLVIMDMDGTIVQYADGHFQSSWDALGRAAGKWEEWQALASFYLPRPDLYHEWSEKNCKLLAGISLEAVSSQLFPPPYTVGFSAFCRYLHTQRIPMGILSGGVGFIARKIQEEVDLDFVVANEVEMRNGHFTGQGQIHVHIKDKGARVRHLMDEYDVIPSETAFIGDHVNDISAWQEVGLRIGMNVKDPRCYPHLHGYFHNFTALQDVFTRLGRNG